MGSGVAGAVGTEAKKKAKTKEKKKKILKKTKKKKKKKSQQGEEGRKKDIGQNPRESKHRAASLAPPQSQSQPLLLPSMGDNTYTALPPREALMSLGVSFLGFHHLDVVDCSCG